jgi:hypothetical protein
LQASVFTIIGYWLQWSELLFSALLLIVFLIAAIFITGKNSAEPFPAENPVKKRKYNN